MLASLFYIALLVAIGYYAKSKGRSPIGWAAIAFFISPLIAGIILFFLKNLNTDGFQGDTIDTTSRPAPSTPEERHRERMNREANKPKEDVDESIRRMEDKLALGKSSEEPTIGDAIAGASAGTVGAATIFTEEKAAAEETMIVEEPVEEIAQPEASSDNLLVEEPQEATIIEETAQAEVAPAPGFCESCGQPLTPGGKFCTNCGAPVGK
ncbi:MAG: zinc ribbon domain-containing protein [Phascolarctobacterium sp.]|nr:zinc ribbon domain-containing protein [Phascolarctobacterium sp.]